MKRRLRRRVDNVLEAVGLKKKPQLETPWARVDSAHAEKAGSLRGWYEAKKRAYEKFSEDAHRNTNKMFAQYGDLVQDSTSHFRETFAEKEKQLEAELEAQQARRYARAEQRLGRGAADEMRAADESLESDDKIKRVRAFMDAVLHQNVRTPGQVFDICDNTDERTAPLLLPAEKRKFLMQLVEKHRPKRAFDVGTWAAAQTALAIMAADDNVHVHSIERSQMMIRCADILVNRMAAKRITLIEDDSMMWCRRKRPYAFDLVFLDHSPLFYQRDLNNMAEAGTLNRGCLVVINMAKGYAAITADALSWIMADKRFKPMHGPPSSALFVYKYLGE
eukprot:TRINITY_DN22764_c0_g1_i1.p1 TRINITY_DN22764_c0_g1~~TRINITY_DN22764_c0_g1_i1.p1  ORF type:complete len:334 (+),score=106.44 TRINITY_DN22764_c0_g1_i1:67-1068(+)